MATPTPPATNERDALVNRILPEMQLSNGSATSLTAPPSLPAGMTPQQRATARFAVEGNAVISGGAGILALEAARALLEHGLSGLALLDLNPSQSTPQIDRLRADFPHACIVALEADVTSAASVTTAMAAAAEALGGVDILCCFAGIVGCTHALEMEEAAWRRTLDVNAGGEFLCAQAAAREMARQGRGGRIVLVASISAHRVNFPQPQVAYNVSKAGVVALAKSLAAEWARFGIRVNSMSPGYMDTILNEGEGLERARNVWTSRNPMGRMGSPLELTGPLVLLCSKIGGSYITGSDLIVDGGATVF